MVKAKKPPKETKPERWQTHVYLSADDFQRLKEIADKESRSTTMQIEYFLRRAIAGYGDPVGSPTPPGDKS